MQNVAFPALSPQFYSFGNNEGRVTNLDELVDNQVGATSIGLDSHCQLYGEIYDVDPHQQYPIGYQFAPSKNPSPLHEIELTNWNKRSIEEIRAFCETDIMKNGEQRNKKRKVAPSLQQSSKIKHQKTSPKRRSQKLNDKITALQKLVSPYGKADTASVLEEAYLYIKILHQKIQVMYQLLKKSSTSQDKELQSGGLCMFPISLLNKLSQDRCYLNISNGDSLNPNM